MKKSILFLVILLLQGCYSLIEPEDDTNQYMEYFFKERVFPYYPMVFDGDPEPLTFPDLDEDRKTLLGIDSDNDGVRDDLEIYINRKYKYDYERLHAKFQVKNTREFFLKAEKLNPKEARYLEKRAVESGCIAHILSKLLRPKSYDGAMELFSGLLAFNTPKRKKAASRATALKAGDIIEYNDLDFDISCPGSIIQKYRQNFKNWEK